MLKSRFMLLNPEAKCASWIITTCGRGILVYIIIGVVMYSPTMKLVASPRRPADEGVPHLRY